VNASQVKYHLRARRNRKSFDDVIVDSTPQYDGPNRLDPHRLFEDRFQID